MSIQDARGTQHGLERPAQRIISLVPSATETLHCLGLADRIVGVTRFCVHPSPWVKQIPKVGGTKDIELDRILELKPDLIVGNCEENTREIFEALDPHVPVWAPLPKTISEAIADIGHLGMLTGTAPMAEKFQAEAKKAWSHAQSSAKPFTYAYFIWHEPWMSISNDTFIARMLESVGGVNIFGDHPDRFPEIDLNGRITAVPDVVFLSSEPFPFKEKHRDQLCAMTNIPSENVRFIDGEYASWHGHRMIEGLSYLTQRAPAQWDIHPTR
jgi:ABC-type Fe3+-hydroxamate transport system substrate-binding protein